MHFNTDILKICGVGAEVARGKLSGAVAMFPSPFDYNLMGNIYISTAQTDHFLMSIQFKVELLCS